MDTFLLKNLSELLQTGIFYAEQGRWDDSLKTMESNPLCRDGSLRSQLAEAADRQELPYLFQDDFQVYFGCVTAERGYCLVGPMSVDFFDRIKRHRFCKHYHIPEYAEKNLRRFTLMEVLQTMCIVTKIVAGREYTDQELVDANRMAMVTRERAANLLIYSEESIPQIAEYVNFPSQSYFGKIFKSFKNMTPRQYRETYKPTEFFPGGAGRGKGGNI